MGCNEAVVTEVGYWVHAFRGQRPASVLPERSGTEDGRAEIQFRAEEGTVCLTRGQIAALFDTTKQNVSLHMRNILAEGKVGESVVKQSLTPASDGKRYRAQIYILDAVFAVGYRVRSPRGVQFRRCATTVLREYLIKGFAMDDEQLKDPKRDYLDDLLHRLRAIRASEPRFHRKVRDLLALSFDYDPASRTAAASLLESRTRRTLP